MTVEAFPLGSVRLRPGLVHRRFELNRTYVKGLRSDNLLQNHYFEAGIWGPPAKPEDDIHWGWESPNSLVRGHFLGHWLSAAARIWENSGDAELKAKADGVVAELARCQEENGGEWVASIPESYLERVVRGRLTWASVYVAEKTLMGLYDAYAYAGNEQALDVLLKASRWFHRWTGRLTPDQLSAVVDSECGGMLELWANLYAVSGAPEHLDLIRRYERRALFDALLRGDDPLTNRHANTTIPEAYGAARAFEVLGEQRYRDVAEAYWRQAVIERGTFATGGQTSAEVWTAKQRLGGRLGVQTQEHCTVYNLMRLADHLFGWTGDPAYLDFRERSLYNGILAQQHPVNGMVTYYLPLRPGSTKVWSTQTRSFWCCSGTLVQAHSIAADGIWYSDGTDVVLAHLIPSEASCERDGTPVRLALDHEDPEVERVPGRMHLDLPIDIERPDAIRAFIRVRCERPVRFALRVRLPWWLAGPAVVLVDGRPEAVTSSPTSYHVIDRVWERSLVEVRLPRRVVAEPLPDDPARVAFLDGPVVLAGLCAEERTLAVDPGDPASVLEPDDERGMDGWTGSYRATGQDAGLRFVPLHTVTDEPFAVYFPVRDREG